jgi:hypothetical protein
MALDAGAPAAVAEVALTGEASIFTLQMASEKFSIKVCEGQILGDFLCQGR